MCSVTSTKSHCKWEINCPKRNNINCYSFWEKTDDVLLTVIYLLLRLFVVGVSWDGVLQANLMNSLWHLVPSLSLLGLTCHPGLFKFFLWNTKLPLYFFNWYVCISILFLDPEHLNKRMFCSLAIF